MRRTHLPERDIWTLADVEALPDDGNRYEILHGELLVTPLPSNPHQRIAAHLTWIAVSWCRTHTGWAVRAPGGVFVSETNWFEPDLCVYAISDATDLHWRDMPAPLLVAEILSPSTVKRDRHGKRPVYLAHGVAEVWLIDPGTRRIERWTSASEFPELFNGSITWTPDPSLPPMVVTEMDLFGPKS